MVDAPWWKILAELPDLENHSDILFELGASGLQLLDSNKAEFYFQGGQDSLSSLLTEIKKTPIKILETSEVQQENWLKNCAELWKQIDLESFKIIPILDEENLDREITDSKDIFIIPGEGFGTGHHSATRMALDIIDQMSQNKETLSLAADIGCGSGILALALTKLFNIPVTAVDIDDAALANARRNIKLNKSEDLIALNNTDIKDINGKFNLIAANIYAEVLISMKGDFSRLLADQGFLLISGIMTSLVSDIKQSFSSPQWTLIEHREDGGWNALLYRYKET